MATSYIPSTDSGFAAWLLNFSTLITASPTTYGLVSGDATAIAAQNTAYSAALALATDPSTRTSVTVSAKDAAKAGALFVVRPYATTISKNAGVDDGDKTAVGVTVPKLVPTPIPAPTALPLLTLVSAIPLVSTLKIVSADTPTSKAKPFGVIGIQLFVSVGTVAATDPDQLAYYSTATKIPALIGFNAPDQGKIASVAARFVTRGGNGGESKIGPWSAILTFNVL